MASCERNRAGRAIAEAARTFVGVRFRRQGRDMRGLDCVGLVVAAAEKAGIAILVPQELPYRGLCVEATVALFRSAACQPVACGRAVEGDVLLRWAAERQPHVAVRSSFGVIEAHAGIGRVIERNLDGDEIWHAVWRLPRF